MRYSDGNVAEPGDLVRIDGRYLGRVIACMDTGRCLPGEEDWAYLGTGIMIDTDFGGLVHYTDVREEIILVERARQR